MTRPRGAGALTPGWRIDKAAANLAALKTKGPDYYALLGLDRNCTATQIRAAYRALVKQHHPDANGGRDHSAARIRELNEAYAVLSDDENRRAYDRQSAAPAEMPRPRPAARPAEIAQEIHLRIEELFRGAKLEVRVKDPARLGETEIYSLAVPPETAPGARFRIARDGGGFVRVKVRVRPDFRFKPRGADLRCDLRVGAQRAAQGGSETLRGVTGKILPVVIPRGAARGEVVRVAGEGLPRPRGGRGDLLVRVVYAPEVRITRRRT